MAAVSNHLMEHKVDTALLLTRALTLIFCLSYFFPFFSSPETSYKGVLMSNLATSALRVHQRVGLAPTFLVQNIMEEDSVHCLLYPLNFLPWAPVTPVLIPIMLYALLHFASFTLRLCYIAGENNASAPRFLISLVESQEWSFLKGAAFVEICIMPLTVINLFFGRASLLTLIIYYQFLSLRYKLRRSTPTRTTFHELRIQFQQLAAEPFIPSTVRTLILSIIRGVTSLAP